RGDGAGARGCAAPEGRNAGSDGLSRAQRRRGARARGVTSRKTRVTKPKKSDKRRRSAGTDDCHTEEEMNKLVTTGAALAIGWASARTLAWEPTKPVEIVVAAGAGGASDQMARMMQAAIQKNKLMSQPMVVSLKGGASGAEALMYMKSSESDPNKVL